MIKINAYDQDGEPVGQVKSKKLKVKSNREWIHNRSPAMPRGVIDPQCWL